MISVRSEVQVLLGPPAFAALQLRLGKPFLLKAATPERKRRRANFPGDIAQLGER